MTGLGSLTGKRFRVSGFYYSARDGYEQEGQLKLENGSKMAYVKEGVPMQLGPQYEIMEYTLENSSEGILELKRVRKIDE